MTNLRNLRIALAVAATAVVSILVLSSWDFKQITPFMDDSYKQVNDTVPKKDSKERKIRDLDDVLDELNDVDLHIDMQKIEAELKEAMKKIDAEKIRMDVERALQEVNIDKMKKEIEESIAKIDWEKMKAGIDRVKEIDMQKMQMDMEKMQKELSKIGPELEKSMEKAKESIEKAKAEMTEYKDFVDGLNQDGLINKKEAYTIKHKDGELTINGKKASDATYKKYKSFLNKHKTFTIEKSDDDFDIDVD